MFSSISYLEHGILSKNREVTKTGPKGDRLGSDSGTVQYHSFDHCFMKFEVRQYKCIFLVDLVILNTLHFHLIQLAGN